MTIPTRVAIAMIALALPTSTIRAQPTPAEVWRTIGDRSYRRLYIMGIVDGAFLAQLQATQFFSDTTVRRAWLKQPPDARVPIDTAFASILKQFGSTNVDAVVETVTRLYEEPANSCLAWYTAVMVAIERLNGATIAAQEKQLADLRRVSAATCKAR